MVTARPSLSLITFLAITATSLVNRASANPTTGFLAKLLELQAAGGLAPRQTGSSSSGGLSIDEFPSQCQKGCATAINAFNTCTSPTCLCKADIDASLNYCINCSVQVVPDQTIIQDGQQVFTTYNSLCAGSGVASLTLSGTSAASSTQTSTSGLLSLSSSNPFTGFAGPSTTITALDTTSSRAVITVTATGTGTGSSSKATPLLGNSARPAPRAGGGGFALLIGFVIAYFIVLA